VALGVFSLPQRSLLRENHGIWNNLIIFQLWLLLLAWPAVALWLCASNVNRAMKKRVCSTEGGRRGRLYRRFSTKKRWRIRRATWLWVNPETSTVIKKKVSIGRGMMYSLRWITRSAFDRVNSTLNQGGWLRELDAIPGAHSPALLRPALFDGRNWYRPNSWR
jgi:hypothetical protein